MARPREFDEKVVLGTAVQCFWSRGYEATSVRGLVEKNRISASLYNAFGDKRALDYYVQESLADRIRHCEELVPREAIGEFFAEILRHSLGDRQHKACMPAYPDFQKIVASLLIRIEAFFPGCVKDRLADGTITRSFSAEGLAHHLLGVLIAVRIQAHVRPERALLEGVVLPALARLDRSEGQMVMK